MAKIIVTTVNGGAKKLVDTNWKFDQSGPYVSVFGPKNEYVGPVVESIEEIQRRINEAEATEEMVATNAKLDKILENQKKIMEALRIK